MLSIKYQLDWKDFFDQQLQKEYFQKILKLIESEYQTKILYPAQSDIFKVFQLCPLKNIKVIILGQDPYHTPGVANGLAFSVNQTSNIFPPSLRNIFEELENDLQIKRTNKDLTDWTEQGVFLINTILTVYKHQPSSCSDWGWEQFTRNLIEYLNKTDERYVYVLLGNYAKKYLKYIDISKHEVIISSHPSPLGYHKGFKNSKIFSEINNKLEKINKERIKW